MAEAFSDRPTTVADYLAILRRRKWIVLVPPIAAALAAFLLSMGQSPLYHASAEVLVNRTTVVPEVTGIDPSGGDPNRFLKTQASIARSPELAVRVASRSDIPGMTASRVLAESSVTPSIDSDLISIAVDDGDANVAARLANTYASEFAAFSKERATASIDQALTDLRAQLKGLADRGQTGSALYAQLLLDQSKLVTAGRLWAGNTSVLQPAVGAEKIRPRPKRNAILGFLFGGVVGLALAFLAEALDRRVRDEHEIDEALGIPLLARIPQPSRALQKTDGLVMLEEPTGAQAETFRKLRTSIEFVNPDGAARTIMVTSPVEQEGKSTTIANLAIALARGNRRVALVDLDLRRPYLSRLFHVGGRPGITDVALKRAELSDALRPIAIATGIQERASQNGHGAASNGRTGSGGLLHLLPAGTIPPMAGEMLQDERLLGVLAELASRFDIVLIDAPPLLAFGDTMTLSTRVDAIFAITRLGRVKRPILHEFARQLQNCQAKLLGYVLTGVEHSESYRYMYEAYEYYAHGTPSEKERV
jgi:Mrp family chromosome partitioning ATPase/capsular polysaccharide biosynthesis protein